MIRIMIEHYYKPEHRAAVDKLLYSLNGVEVISKQANFTGVEYTIKAEDNMIPVIQMLCDCEVYHIERR